MTIDKSGITIGSTTISYAPLEDFPERLVLLGHSALGAFYRRVLVEVSGEDDVASVQFIFPAVNQRGFVVHRGNDDLLGLSHENWLALRGQRIWIELPEPILTK